jgi:asparagine synthase (glutamine-hydrolysing)
MCGIAGFIDSSLSNKEQADSLLEKMLETIAHRGPDARGKWIDLPVALGQNRLAIIDLSEDGNQPMFYDDYVITFNGEIYNYIEVREELIKKGYHFKTSSDTEVILVAYKEYGEACVNYFVGMWAFAIYTKSSGKLFVSRDRFGIKPFYYIHSGNKFYFGSEYKPLKVSPVFTNEINLNSVCRGLQLGWITYQDETYFTQIKQLPAACNLVFEKGNITIHKYWDIDFNRKFDGTFEDKKTAFKNLFKNSINLHMRSDVEIAVCLSGGIDSSALSSFMSILYPEKKFKSFSIYYDGKNEVDERPFINSVHEKYPNILLNLYQPRQDEIIDLVSKIFYISDIPATGSSFISHYYLIEQIHKQGIKVVLDGQGADEYLAGYMHSMYRYFADELRGFQMGSFISDFRIHAQNQNKSIAETFDVLGKSVLSSILDEQQLYAFEYKHYFPNILNNHTSNNSVPFNMNSRSSSKLNSFLYQLLTISSLPTILHYVDRMTMAHSVESRVPFLDHRLIELAFSFSNSDKINKSVTKYILRESLKDVLPDKVYNRKDKKGFVTPGEINWLRKPLRHLLDIDYSNFDYWNKNATEKVIHDYLAGNNKNAKLVWRIATLNHWLKNI